MANLRSVDRLLAPAVADAIAALHLGAEDDAAVRLAGRYAALLDEAEPKRTYAAWLRTLSRAVNPDDQAAVEALHGVADALSEHSVASDLGPKLLAILESLGATPHGRARLRKETGSGKDAGKLAALRAARPA